MSRPVITARRAQLEALLDTARALQAQVAALIAQEDQEDGDAEPSLVCPRCGGTEFAHASDDLAVCAGCNANLLRGELLTEEAAGAAGA